MQLTCEITFPVVLWWYSLMEVLIDIAGLKWGDDCGLLDNICCWRNEDLSSSNLFLCWSRETIFEISVSDPFTRILNTTFVSNHTEWIGYTNGLLKRTEVKFDLCLSLIPTYNVFSSILEWINYSYWDLDSFTSP